MKAVNYFEIFGIKPTFFPDLTNLKKVFYLKSREFHPDFYTQASEEEKANALIQSSLINKAYKVLQHPELRFHHILQLEGMIKDDSKDEMQQSFLMDMMEFNEEIMELQMDYSKDKFDQLSNQLTHIKSEKLLDHKSIMESYPDVNSEQLVQLKNLYFENKYLARLNDNLHTMEKM